MVQSVVLVGAAAPGEGPKIEALADNRPHAYSATMLVTKPTTRLDQAQARCIRSCACVALASSPRCSLIRQDRRNRIRQPDARAAKGLSASC
jgi:hypothetical protein